MASKSEILAFHREDEIAAQVAMHDDAIARYLARSSTYRQFWDVLIDHYLTPTRSDLNFVIEGTKAAMLARIYPDEKASMWGEILHTLRLLPHFPLNKWLAAKKLEDTMVSRKNEFGKEHGRYIYVFLLGTRPEFQGQGLGSALLQHVNAIADAEGMHCFLESSSEGSRRLYMRHGYVEREVFKAAPDAPPMFFMSRPPSKQLTTAIGAL
ncbi:hypothetical protein WJX75_008709 [Coccomyxa subellipsoidea]|uniref:N-acetyltransferase domain-containing protein n=1 Tax=Coccomyxa subellipsoidea TaxID=248742 RepID=A0ABR2YCJ5_9CHLO